MRRLASVIAALIFMIPAATASDEAVINDTLSDLEAAWVLGDFDTVAMLSRRAVSLMEASACPLRSDAAVAAFMGGIAGDCAEHSASSRYLFWVASEVNSRLAVLPGGAGELADGLRAEPGETVSDDAFFLASPYRTAALQVDCAASRLDPGLLLSEPEHVDRVVVGVLWPHGARWPRRSAAQIVYAFPPLEGALLAEQAFQSRARYFKQRDVELFTFDPCQRFSRRDLTFDEICRAPR